MPDHRSESRRGVGATCPVNLWSDEFNADYWGSIGALQHDASLGTHLQGDTTCYVVTRFDEVFEVLRDYKRYSSEAGVAILGGATARSRRRTRTGSCRRISIPHA